MDMDVAMESMRGLEVVEEEAWLEEGICFNVTIVVNGVIKALNMRSQGEWMVTCFLFLHKFLLELKIMLLRLKGKQGQVV
ncbi:hypothetical protein GOP47_0023367 [Adiantum capillus-veneris]|uniref:Uncharacterized protein n=1 Tax=Adiantum capillus-veneris TaxID=13818 RepID=A0A9D4Z525_ADICA|nr:hypothetical protein GOP47_0023367 [Adiantum capillus-veneris]